MLSDGTGPVSMDPLGVSDGGKTKRVGVSNVSP